ncbi:MAG TPA: forkhead-associated protein, partial [Leucothrix mucor]|nr:forkhead-associated protein [Leucothrix mucor]
LTRQKLQKTQDEYKSIINNLNALKFPARLTRIIRRKIGLSGSNPTEYEHTLIQKVAEKLGESQLELPDDFIAEIHHYISKWQQSPRMKNAMARLNKNNYIPIIQTAMKKEGLPAQFLYLCLQESNFNSKAIGPETRYGIAKGAWQFLPETGQEFGLSTGSMTDVAEYDFTDERFDFNKATKAAAKYLKHIYSTEAQASGLLVMAGYNYGHNRVRRMIKKMPNNPKERNFWRFASQYKIPDETYQYVLYIFSAAVIGEDPKYFGFHFKSPL